MAELKPYLHRRVARREWTGDRDAIAADRRVRRRAFEHVRASGARGKIDDERPPDVYTRPRVVEDVEHVEDLQRRRGTPEDAGVRTEDHAAANRRRAAAAAASFSRRAAASFSPATRMTRRPPVVGTVKVSDTSGSPLTVASARTSAPAVRPVNSALPLLVGACVAGRPAHRHTHSLVR